MGMQPFLGGKGSFQDTENDTFDSMRLLEIKKTTCRKPPQSSKEHIRPRQDVFRASQSLFSNYQVPLTSKTFQISRKSPSNLPGTFRFLQSFPRFFIGHFWLSKISLTHPQFLLRHSQDHRVLPGLYKTISQNLPMRLGDDTLQSIIFHSHPTNRDYIFHSKESLVLLFWSGCGSGSKWHDF